MRLAMSTSSHGRLLRHQEVYFNCEQALKVCAEGGFKVINLDFIEYSKPGQPMRGSDWEPWCHMQRTIADELGLDIAYAHAPFYEWRADQPDGDELYEELIKRSIQGAGIMGVRQIVFHPGSVSNETWYSHRESLKRNLQFYTKYASLCDSYGITAAIENMMEPECGRRFGSSTEELLELYDKLQGRGRFGICWDFGHAHMADVQQCAALRQIGSRLTMLHVNDNFGRKDDHLAPYFGTIPWADIMRTLRFISYPGDFIFENFSFFDGAPEELRIPIMQLCVKIGEYLCAKMNDNQ